jgi:hypothetical protein
MLDFRVTGVVVGGRPSACRDGSEIRIPQCNYTFFIQLSLFPLLFPPGSLAVLSVEPYHKRSKGNLTGEAVRSMSAGEFGWQTRSKVAKA